VRPLSRLQWFDPLSDQALKPVVVSKLAMCWPPGGERGSPQRLPGTLHEVGVVVVSSKSQPRQSAAVGVLLSTAPALVCTDHASSWCLVPPVALIA
jgi:hypothetical protein